MATDIHIKNFQSIKDLNLKIDGFTVLIGKNNIGKSAIIRAIKSALDNESGKENIRLGESTIEVQVTRPDIDFKWSKGAETFYDVTLPGQKKETYTKLNRAVPEPVIRAGFDKISIEDKMENPLIANQFKSLFLLDKRGSVITEVLTDLYNIDIITIADEKCQKDLKSNKSLLKTREVDLKTLQATISKYKDIETIKEDLRVITELDARKDTLEEEIQTLLSFEIELKDLIASVERLKEVSKIKIPEVNDSVVTDYQWLKEKDTELTECATSFKRLKGITKVKIPTIDETLAVELEWILGKEKEINDLQSIVDHLKGVKKVNIPTISNVETLLTEVGLIKSWDDDIKTLDKRLSIPIPDISELESTVTKIDTFVQDLTLFIKNEQDFRAVALSTKTVRDELKSVIAEFTEKNKELELIKACPLCDRPFHD